jgi:energy-coupling factor transporter ATP-binding protein EcfA2
MIKKLVLKKFGKFINETLDFAPITIVSGFNEAGKTTVFDALFDALCNPPGNTREGKELKRRYGEDRQVDIEFEGEKLQFDVSEFRNLYALRAGNINIEMTDQSTWMEKVKSNLFSGGIDPNLIKANLDRRASIKGSMAHNRERIRLESDRDQAKKQLKELKAKRDSILEEEKQVTWLKKNSQEMEVKLREEEQELANLKQKLELEEKIGIRKKMDGFLEFLDEGEKIEKEIKSLTIFRDNQTQELDRLQQKMAKLKSDQRLREAAIKNSQEVVENMQNEKRELDKKKEKTRVLSELADNMNEKIKSFISNMPMTSVTSWNKTLLFAGIIALIAGITVAALIEGNVMRVVIASTGLLLFALLGLLAKKPKVTIDQKQRERFFRKIMDEWRKSTQEDDIAQWQTMEGFQEALLSKRNAYRELKEKIIKVDGELHTKLEKLESEKRDFKRLGEDLQNLVYDEKQWLDAKGVANRDEYIRNVTKYRDLSQRRKQWDVKLVDILKESNLENSQDLRRLCDRTLREFDETGIPNVCKSVNDILALKRAANDKSQEIANISKELQKFREELKEKGGVIRGSLGDIPDQIIHEEGRIQKYDSMIENNLLTREAAELASKIFSIVAQDSDAALGELSKSLGEEFREIVGTPRKVIVSDLDTSSISMTDAGGAERPLEDLSSGTRNSFLFAARLALAKRAAGDRGFLILDEPFTSFDSERLGNALAMLKKFREKNAWQIIFLTKDIFVVDKVKNFFSREKIKEHCLDV